MTTKEIINVDGAWKTALGSWNSPSIPFVITPQTKEEMRELGVVGKALQGELAFMKYPEFQTYLNLERIVKTFPQNSQRAVETIAKHEVGHRFCPYDIVTMIIMNHAIEKTLQGQKLPYDSKAASKNILNLFTDTCINTRLYRSGDSDIPWAYEELSKGKKDSKLWRVYAKSMETAWGTKILPDDTKLNKEELEAAQAIARLFDGNFFDRTGWRQNGSNYATLISKFLEDEKGDGESSMGNASGNMPQQIEEKTEKELAKRLAEIGSNGLPGNKEGLKEFKEIMAGFGKGDPVKASISFYDMLSKSYDVMFATKPFGRPRTNPFQPVKWNPSMDADKLDVNYSAQVGGKIIPGINTYMWNTRRREVRGGLEEVNPNLDLYLDSSMSMQNPIEGISLPVLAGFVAAKKANRKGATVRSTNFSGEGQSKTQEATRDLQSVFENLVIHYNGGTVFPQDVLSAGEDPRQAIIITDTFIANKEKVGNAIAEFKKRNKDNRVTIYALNPVIESDYLQNAGAEVIHGTTTDIFKRVIGKADEVYTR